MILLSALLASLGLKDGERPAERAQVEFSTAVAVAHASKAEAPAQVRPVELLPILPALLLVIVAVAAAPVRSLRDRLSLKQSWLH